MEKYLEKKISCNKCLIICKIIEFNFRFNKKKIIVEIFEQDYIIQFQEKIDLIKNIFDS